MTPVLYLASGLVRTLNQDQGLVEGLVHTHHSCHFWRRFGRNSPQFRGAAFSLPLPLLQPVASPFPFPFPEAALHQRTSPLSLIKIIHTIISLSWVPHMVKQWVNPFLLAPQPAGWDAWSVYSSLASLYPPDL